MPKIHKKVLLIKNLIPEKLNIFHSVNFNKNAVADRERRRRRSQRIRGQWNHKLNKLIIHE